jgi:hypothetical protein
MCPKTEVEAALIEAKKCESIIKEEATEEEHTLESIK